MTCTLGTVIDYKVNDKVLNFVTFSWRDVKGECYLHLSYMCKNPRGGYLVFPFLSAVIHESLLNHLPSNIVTINIDLSDATVDVTAVHPLHTIADDVNVIIDCIFNLTSLKEHLRGHIDVGTESFPWKSV